MNKKVQLLTVMLCFFAMGFVDLVGAVVVMAIGVLYLFSYISKVKA